MGESFFQRWSRRKVEQTDADKADEHIIPADAGLRSAPVSGKSPHDDPDTPLPTLDDVASLTRDSDYSVFVSRGVDRNVRRAAMKKLFADPHFNVMDGLDIYIDDYNKPSPLTPAMLAALQHTQSMFAAVAKQEEERKEREAAESQELADDPESDALSEGREDGIAEPAHADSLPEPVEQQHAGSNFSGQQDPGMPNQEDEFDNSIRHSG